MKNIKTLGLLFLLGVLVVPLFVSAQPTDLPAPVTDYNTLTNTIRTAGRWMLGILLTLAAIFIILSAYYYLTAGGNEDSMKKAKDYLIWAIVAIAVGLIAGGVSSFVQSFFGTTVTP